MQLPSMYGLPTSYRGQAHAIDTGFSFYCFRLAMELVLQPTRATAAMKIQQR